MEKEISAKRRMNTKKRRKDYLGWQAAALNKVIQKWLKGDSLKEIYNENFDYFSIKYSKLRYYNK